MAEDLLTALLKSVERARREYALRPVVPPAPCGCGWDGHLCPHCGRANSASHVTRCHEAAVGPVGGKP